MTFGGTAATSITNVGSTSVTVLIPTKPAGAVDLFPNTPGGGSVILSAGYTFANPPTITDISPLIGPRVGRSKMTISGTNLTDASTVTFGGTPGTSVTVESDSSVTVITPAKTAGTVDVILTTPTAGTKVTITGTNITGTSVVTFGVTAGTSIEVVSATSVTVVTPAKLAGVTDVESITRGGSITSIDTDTFVKAPTIAGLPLEPPVVIETPMATTAHVDKSGSNYVPVVPEIVESRVVVEPKVVVEPTPRDYVPVVPVLPVIAPKVVEYVGAVVHTKEDIPVVNPLALIPTPAQGFTSKGRGAFRRRVQPPKTKNSPKANRQFVLLVHAPESKLPSVGLVKSNIPKTKVAVKESPIAESAGRGRSAIDKWARNSKVGTGSRQVESVEEKSFIDKVPPVPVVAVTPPAAVLETPTTPTPNHGVSAMNNNGAKTPFNKPKSTHAPVVPATPLGLSTVDQVATTQPTEPNFFVLATINESVDKARDTIGRRVRKSVIVVIGLLVIVASIDGYAVSVVTRQSNRLESEYREMIAANESVLVSAVASDLAIRSFLLSGDRSFVDKFEAAKPQLVEAIADLQRVADEVGDQGLIQLADNSSVIVQLWLTTFVDRTMVIASADTPRSDQLAGAELINNLRGASIDIGNYISEVNDKAVAVASRIRRQTVAIAALALVVAFLLIVILLVLGGSDISFPLINLSHVVNRIYRGEVKARADDTAGPAEIRAVSRAVNELAYQQETAHEWVTQFNLSKSNFLNTVNHELRTPLTSITGYSELLGEDSELTHTERTRMATVINRNAFRLNDLIDNMLTVLRIDSMEVKFKMSTFDIRSVVNESVESFRALADSREQIIVADLGDEPFTVWADESEILRVVSNLISNGLKFSNSGGQIEVSVRSVVAASGKHEVAVTVSDTGIGIVDAELQHVGSRFYRSSNAITAAIPGTGIGLMIVGFIVREHGGSWSLASTENAGTRAEFRLPIALASVPSVPSVGPSSVVGN